MAVICGIELKSTGAMIAVIRTENNSIAYIDTDPMKINIDNDENISNVRSFYDTFCNFVRTNHIDTVVIKKRAKRGKMAGGAVSFKLEGLIQLNGIVPVDFTTAQKIAQVQKRTPIAFPSELKRYQEQAYLAACVWEMG